MLFDKSIALYCWNTLSAACCATALAPEDACCPADKDGVDDAAVQTFAGPGTPRGDDPGDDTVPLGPQAARMALLDRINAARDERDAAPLRLSEALSAAAADLLPEEGEGAALAGDLSSALPDGSEGQWRALNALATACGGCGREMTEADLAGFMDRWLAPGGRGEALLAERFDAVGAAFHATGDGRKSAVVVLGVRRETP